MLSMLDKHDKTRIFLTTLPWRSQIQLWQYRTTSNAHEVKAKTHSFLLRPRNGDVWVNLRRRSTHSCSRLSLDSGQWSAPCSGHLTPLRVLYSHRTGRSARPRDSLDGCEDKNLSPCRESKPSRTLYRRQVPKYFRNERQKTSDR